MTQIKLRRDTSAAFASSNPILGNGEPAYETDTKKLKIGDGTTAYTQLEYFSAGGGGSTNISATLPLKIVDGVISLEVDGQTIQIVDGKLHANLDELGNEVNTLAGDVAGVQADLLNKQDKFETQVPLSISNSSITTSVATGITETSESWTGGDHDKLVTVDVSALNVDANSDWKIHLSGYMGNYYATSTNTNVLFISAEKNTIFRVWFGSQYFRIGNSTSKFEKIPGLDREFFYEIVHQKNGTEFTFHGTNLVDPTPLPISVMSSKLGQTSYTTLAGQGKLKDFAFLINSYQFQRIDRDISKSYFEADGVRYRLTSVKGTNTLNLNIGSGLAITDGKLTASSTAPTNMVTTDTEQTISGNKELTGITTISNDIKFTIGKKITTPDGEWLMQLGPGSIGIGTSMKPLKTYDGSNYYLHNKSIIAGNGIKITEPNNSEIKISSTGGAGMPSSKYIDLTLGASGSTYTAPANGYYFIASQGTGTDNWIEFVNGDISQGVYGTLAWVFKLSLPIAKGHTTQLDYNNINTTSYTFRFIYAEGEI